MPVSVKGVGNEVFVKGVSTGIGVSETIDAAPNPFTVPPTGNGDITVTNNDVANPTGCQVAVAGADAANFALDMPDTGVLAPGGGAQAVNVSVSGVAGTTYNTDFEIYTPGGDTLQVPVTGVVPQTMSNLAQTDGAVHLYSFDDLTDTGSNPGANLVLAGGSVIQATTIPGCLGQLKNTTQATDDARIDTGVQTDWHRNGAATWEFVFKITTWSNAKGLWRHGLSYSYANMAFQLGSTGSLTTRLNLTGPSWVQKLAFADITTAQTGVLIYMAVKYNYDSGTPANSTVTVTYKKDGDVSATTTTPFTWAPASVSNDDILFGGNHSNENTLPAEYGHFALYRSVLSDPQIALRLAVLGI